MVLALAGCSAITDQIPSFWDANQSAVITDIQQMTRHINCNADLKPQLHVLFMRLEWYDIYAATKRTQDMVKLGQTMLITVKEFQDRTAQGPVSPAYCDIKKKILVQQADIIATTVQGRF